MHRTHFVPRLLGWGALLLSLVCLAGPLATPARAQQGGPEITQNATIVTLGVGTTQTYQSKFDLKQVQNDAPKVLMVRPIPGKSDQVIFEAIAPGRARVNLADVKGNKEIIEVVVISDRVKELRDLITRTLPTASVTVNSTDAGTIVLGGYVLTTDDARALQQLALAIGGNVVNNVRIGGVQTVQLEVIVAIVNRSEARNLSTSWLTANNNWFLTSLTGGPGGLASALTNAGGTINSSLASTTGSNNVAFGVINANGGHLGFIQALRTEGLTKILAEPRVTTLSGRPAYILSGGETPILTSSGVGAPSVSYKQFGTVVHFLPIVLGNGKIHLEVRPEISNINPANGITIPGTTPTAVPGFDTRSAQVAVQIEDGQTLAIGGLIQNRATGNTSRIPIIGDIPGLGMLFSANSYNVTEEEMIILVTPRLVDPVDCCKIPKFLPGRETRVPDDFEFFCELILEAPRGPRSVGLAPHTYTPAFRNAPSIYPCASGHCGPNGLGGPGCSTCAPGSIGGGLSAAPRTNSNIGTASLTVPTLRDVPATPTSNSNFRIGVEGDLPPIPSVMPIPSPAPIQPSLGGPSLPVPSAREFDARPQLPPVSLPR
jgi:pilus assembly protein CpaC